MGIGCELRYHMTSPHNSWEENSWNCFALPLDNIHFQQQFEVTIFVCSRMFSLKPNRRQSVWPQPWLVMDGKMVHLTRSFIIPKNLCAEKMAVFVVLGWARDPINYPRSIGNPPSSWFIHQLYPYLCSRWDLNPKRTWISECFFAGLNKRPAAVVFFWGGEGEMDRAQVPQGILIGRKWHRKSVRCSSVELMCMKHDLTTLRKLPEMV